MAAAIASGVGVPPTSYAAMSAAAGKVNLPTYRHALVDEWIAGVPGLPERLAAGGTGESTFFVVCAAVEVHRHGDDVDCVQRDGVHLLSG